MAENLTREEMEEAQAGLIAPDASGPITSLDHRTFNSMLMDFLNSFLDFDVYTNADGKVVDARLKKRLVSKIVWCDANMTIGETFLDKPFASDTLSIGASQGVPPFTKITISFKQQPV